MTTLPVTGDVMSRDEVAAWLKINPRQVERLGVPYFRLGERTVRYRRHEVEAWLEARRVAA
jgi:hypothetical protein